ncbi:ATP-binding protein [Nocardia alba]|uniref:Histidine kinase/DNA gyrase B/HSP90-like ATPase n=1 Tax=Nocardia alba TaxID=225051 RepID=A0A4R1FLK7_9NOCA|nr:ATP-binding protein [Nocardia alba]TCJ94910.1 histidine kinase/DNA gyrase B/HSP90-like ATPase [Nocardia alba]
MDFDVAAPDPAGMVASLSSLGYSLPAAVADLVDNSLSAEAKNVDVDFTWEGQRSWIAVADDGRGMTEPELVIAMTVAARGPSAERSATDLGRFGVGLKSASFSQCRKLTVATTRDGSWHARTWDLGIVEQYKEWRLLRDPGDATTSLLRRITGDMQHGTVVLWEQLSGYHSTFVSNEDEKTQAQFYAEAERTEAHLAMVFARFLQRPARCRLRVRGSELSPWDPFLSAHASVQRIPWEPLPLGSQSVRVEPFVLPTAQRLSAAEHESAAGQKGWLGQQGFYVYRRDRLILAGGWLGIRGLRREEKYNLARIAVDIPAEADTDWGVDVRKASVVPPVSLRRHLERIANYTREAAARSARQRGEVVSRAHGAPLRFAWNVKRQDGRIILRINRNHPLVKAAMGDRVGNPDVVRSMIRLLEETVPVMALRVLHETDTVDDPEPFGGPGPAAPETVAIARHVYETLLGQGRSPEDARGVLSSMSPFDEQQGFWNS